MNDNIIKLKSRLHIIYKTNNIENRPDLEYSFMSFSNLLENLPYSFIKQIKDFNDDIYLDDDNSFIVDFALLSEQVVVTLIVRQFSTFISGYYFDRENKYTLIKPTKYTKELIEILSPIFDDIENFGENYFII